MITAEEVRALLDYYPETGVFRWKVRMGGILPGSIAGGDDGHGYLRVKIKGKRYMAHRLAWIYTHGAWPEAEIDHINSIKSDNRIVNLRPATRLDNCKNKRAHRNNTSGYKGVSYVKSMGKYRASIRSNGADKHLGVFDDPQEAYGAYCRAARELHGDFARLE